MTWLLCLLCLKCPLCDAVDSASCGCSSSTGILGCWSITGIPQKREKTSSQVDFYFNALVTPDGGICPGFPGRERVTPDATFKAHYDKYTLFALFIISIHAILSTIFYIVYIVSGPGTETF
jgi:hypothetical protein